MITLDSSRMRGVTVLYVWNEQNFRDKAKNIIPSFTSLTAK